jgi:hypothetical protein
MAALAGVAWIFATKSRMDFSVSTGVCMVLDVEEATQHLSGCNRARRFPEERRKQRLGNLLESIPLQMNSDPCK